MSSASTMRTAAPTRRRAVIPLRWSRIHVALLYGLLIWLCLVCFVELSPALAAGIAAPFTLALSAALCIVGDV
jgi:hypothetical protein